MRACVYFMGLFVYTLNYLYKSQSWPGFSRSSWRCSVFETWHGLQTWSPYQRETPAAWLGSQNLHPEVTHSLAQPQTLPNLNPKTPPASDPPTPPALPLLSQPPHHHLPCGTYPCRCHGYGPHHCHSCTPGLYGGHRAVLRGNPGWAERHTPCSIRSRPGLSSLLGDRMEAQPDSHTPPDIQQSPTVTDIRVHFS